MSNEVWKKGRKTRYKPDSRKQFEIEGSNLQVISLATNLPEIKFKNKDFESIWKKIARQNWFLTIYQELEKELYKKGIYAVGFEKDEHNIKIKIAEVVDYEVNNFELSKIRVKVDSIIKNKYSIDLIEEYDLSNEDSYIKAYVKSYGKEKNRIKDIFPKYEDKLNTSTFIPWIIFKNRWDSKPDLELVNPEWFELLDELFTQLAMEGYHSLPIYEVNTNLGGIKSDQVLDAIYSNDNRVIKTSSLSSFSLAKPFEQSAGISLSQQILQKIESVKYWIKESLFFKKSSQDGGTKNMHSLEAMQLNSNFEDYIETKANLREDLFLNFLILLFKFIGKELNEEEVEITVTGSSKWLELQATKALTNQSGVALNQNQQTINHQLNSKGENEDESQ